jgi:hypothetical protein
MSPAASNIAGNGASNAKIARNDPAAIARIAGLRSARRATLISA